MADVQDVNGEDGFFNLIDDPVDTHPKRTAALPRTGKRFPGIGIALKRRDGGANSSMERAVMPEEPSVGLIGLTLKNNPIQGPDLGRSLAAIFPSFPF